MAKGSKTKKSGGRRIFTEAEKAAWVEDWRQSGKAVTRYAKEMGLTPTSLQRWAEALGALGGSKRSRKSLATVTSLARHGDGGGDGGGDGDGGDGDGFEVATEGVRRRVAGASAVEGVSEESAQLDTLVPLSQLEAANAEISRLRTVSRRLIKTLEEVVG